MPGLLPVWGGKTGNGPGRTGRIGNCGACAITDPLKAGDKIGQQRVLAVKQMCASGYVDPQAATAFAGGPWRVTPAPIGKCGEFLGIGEGIAGLDIEGRHQRTRIGQRDARNDAC